MICDLAAIPLNSTSSRFVTEVEGVKLRRYLDENQQLCPWARSMVIKVCVGYLKRYNRTLTPFTVRELNPPVTGTSRHESLATTFALLNSREMFLSSNFGLYFKLFLSFLYCLAFHFLVSLALFR